MLKIESVTKTYGSGNSATQVLKNIDLTVKRGEVVILTGPSGSGKSTLLSIIGALLTPTSGSITLDNQDWSVLSEREITDMRLKDIGFIFQASHLIPYLPVKEQLTYVAEAAGQTKISASKRADQLLDDIGLSERKRAYPRELSGGERQRTAIARAFMNQPKLLLADEPTASLDKQRATEVVLMIQARVKESQSACIMITHDQRLFDYADRLFILDDGQLTLTK